MDSAIEATDSSISKVTKRTLSVLDGTQWFFFSYTFLYSQFTIKLEDSYNDIREREEEEEEEDEKGEDEEEVSDDSDNSDERVWREVDLIPKIHMNYSYQY
jgi:hypothetical protein